MVHRLDVQHEGPAGNSKPLSRFCLSGSRRSERQKRGQPAPWGTIQDIWRRSDGGACCFRPSIGRSGLLPLRLGLSPGAVAATKRSGTKSANDHGSDLSHHHRLRCAAATRRGRSVRDQDRRPHASRPHSRGCRSKSMSARAAHGCE